MKIIRIGGSVLAAHPLYSLTNTQEHYLLMPDNADETQVIARASDRRPNMDWSVWTSETV